MFLSILVLLACHRHSELDFYNVVNDNFLIIADTNSYRFNSFVVFPDQPEDKYAPTDSFFVSFSDTIVFDKGLKKMISLILKNTPDFVELLNYPLDIKQLNIEHIRNTGQFVLIPKNQYGRSLRKKETIGELSFYTPYMHNGKAILCYKKNISQKVGVIYMLLLKNANNTWVVVQKKEIERW